MYGVKPQLLTPIQLEIQDGGKSNGHLKKQLMQHGKSGLIMKMHLLGRRNTHLSFNAMVSLEMLLIAFSQFHLLHMENCLSQVIFILKFMSVS